MRAFDILDQRPREFTKHELDLYFKYITFDYPQSFQPPTLGKKSEEEDEKLDDQINEALRKFQNMCLSDMCCIHSSVALMVHKADRDKADRGRKTKPKKRSLPTTSDSSGKPAAVDGICVAKRKMNNEEVQQVWTNFGPYLCNALGRLDCHNYYANLRHRISELCSRFSPQLQTYDLHTT